MPYCAAQDVIDEFKALDVNVGTNPIITTAKIEEWIAQSDAYINARVGKVYQVPIAGTNSLLVLKKISIGLTAERIANILRMKAVVPEGSQVIQKDLIKEAREDLKMIVNGDIVLGDATLISTAGAVSSFTGENCVERAFYQGKQQW